MSQAKNNAQVEQTEDHDPVEQLQAPGGMAEDGDAYDAEPPEADAVIAALQAERDELRDRMLRAYAEAENARKRAEKDRRDASLYGGAKMARDLLPVFDNLNRALEAAGTDTRAAAPGLVDGIELTLRELTNVLARHGVERVVPQPGDTFDPHMHEAMFEAPVPDFAAGQIIQVMAEGFRLHDQLLRPAQVGVSSRPPG